MLNFDYLKQVDSLGTPHGFGDMTKQRQAIEPVGSAFHA